ncbi:MAG: hypothetical protein ACNA7I_05070 [Candidatus Methanoperedens sp.]
MINNTETTETHIGKDAVLTRLEEMLGKMPENRRQPIIDLINRRKIELGLLQSGLPVAGYRLKKKHPKDTNAVPVPWNKPKKPIPGKNKEAIHKIAKTVGRISETDAVAARDIDIKDEPLKKDKKILEEIDSYKY